MCADFDAGSMPKLSNFGGDKVFPHGDISYTGGEGEVADVLGRPGRVGVERVNDGFPRVKGHDGVEHGLVVDLDDKAVENGFVDGTCGLDNGSERCGDGVRVGREGISEEVNVGILSKDSGDNGKGKRVILVFDEGGEEVFSGGVVGGDEGILVERAEVDFKESMAELVIQEKSFVRVRIGIAEDAAEGMSDVGGLVTPGVVKTIRWLGARGIGRGDGLVGLGSRLGGKMESKGDRRSNGGYEKGDDSDDNGILG